MNKSILAGHNLSKRFPVKSGFTASQRSVLTALDGVTVSLAEGSTLGIAGESGCGKSTLGKILAGLLKPDAGSVSYSGVNIADLSQDEFRKYRLETQMIFQDPFSSLNPRMRTGDIIAEPLVIQGKMHDSAARHIKTAALMETVGLNPDHYDRFPHEFSGGQRQRIGIARALAASPRILIADEPVSALDISIQAQIINLLQALKADFKLSMVIITHDLTVLRHLSDRIAIMYLGAVMEQAPAETIFKRCLHPYTEALISAMPLLEPAAPHSRIILSGDIPSPLNLPCGCRFHTRCRYAADICKSEPPMLVEKADRHFAACHLSDSIFGSQDRSL